MRGCQRHKTSRRLSIATACVFLIALLFACSPQMPPVPSESELVNPTMVTEPSATAPLFSNDPFHMRGLPGDRKDRLMVGVNDPDRLNLNPFALGTQLFPIDPSGFYQPVFQTLFVFEPTQLVYRSVLAESFELSDRSLKIALREDVLWHDGYSLTAQDVLFTMDAHRKFNTDKGRVFARYVTEIVAESDHSLDISFRESEKNAGWYILDTLSHMVIAAQHIWEDAVAGASDMDSLLDRSTRVVGTGPWKFYQEDAASISFIRHSVESDAKPLYLTILKYAQAPFAFYAIENSEIDLLIAEYSAGDVNAAEEYRKAESQQNPDLLCIHSGQTLGGLAINYGSRQELGRRSFRHLLVAIADPDITGELWSDYPIEITRRDVLTIPSVMEKLDRNALESILGEVSGHVLDALIEEAGLTRQSGGQICMDGVPIEPLTLIYPEYSNRIASACSQYAKMAEEQGLTIHTRPLTVDRWRNALTSGDYELAYMESSVNETFVETIERIAAIPSRKDGELVTGKEFDVIRARDVLEAFPDGHSRSYIVARYQALAEWLLREWLFIPLGAGYKEVALESRFVHTDAPLNTLYAFPVLTRERPPSK